MARILVVDDEENILALLRTILRLGGHDVVTARNEDEGFEVLRREQIDLIVLDLRIGEFDGREFFRRARTDGFSGAIVIISAYGALRAARELGADGAIEKPFEPSELTEEIDRLLTPRNDEAPDESQLPPAPLFRIMPRVAWTPLNP
jgi:DNA-binding response OmpR family regulator